MGSDPATSSKLTDEDRVPEHRPAPKEEKKEKKKESAPKTKAERPDVMVTYKGRQYAISADAADGCDCTGELIDLVKETYGLGRYTEGYEGRDRWGHDEDDDDRD